MNGRNKTSNFLYSVIIYFSIMTLIVFLLNYLLNLNGVYGFVLLRAFIAIYLASIKRIKIFKEQ